MGTKAAVSRTKQRLFCLCETFCQQKVCDVHGANALRVPGREFVRAENIFRVVVMDLQQTGVFPLHGRLRGDFLRDLHIELVISALGDKVDFAVRSFTDQRTGTSAADLALAHTSAEAGEDLQSLLFCDAEILRKCGE